MNESEGPKSAPALPTTPAGDAGDPATSIAAYAELVVALAAAADEKVDRGALLASRGLDEASWDRLDDEWQRRISEAGDGAEEEDGVPPLLAAYAEAFTRAERARAPKDVVPLEKFALALRWIQKTGDPVKSVERAGITLQQFLQANQYWTEKAVNDPEVAEKMQGLL